MKSIPKEYIVLASIISFLIVQGCGPKIGAGISPSEKANTVQKAESAQLLPSVSSAKVAESEEFFSQGLKLYEEYNYQGAIESYDKAIAANPANFKVYTAKGIALCFEDDYVKGMALIQKTLEMKPDYVPAFYDMAMAYKLQNNYDQALYWFEKTIQGDPKNTWSYYGIATIYADRGKTAESLQYLARAIELDQVVKEVAQQQSHFAKMRNLPEFQALVR